ncbi:MAG: tRNA (guanosine(46)-N7)-methyltransferase TrmB [Firmicutes bacterium]|nr:tRNA (guanosine(46)-N7)-methyltransferase TrmB [Bacillota bacterium]
MRHRPVKNKELIIEEGRQWLVSEPESLKGRWASLFDEQKPLYLEIGSGKGKFISEEALKHPENNYLACEGGGKIYPRILQKIAELELTNLRVIPAYHLKERPCFEAGELDGIYLNFSDPWPKARNEKRRLTHRGFLEQYRQFVKPGGFLCFKTDNDDLFEWSLEEFEACGLDVRRVTRDLHNSEWKDELAMTEYETKFSERGKTINYAFVVF